MFGDEKIILIIDDNDVNVRMAKNLLESRLKCKVYTASNGIDGLRALRDYPVVHLLILDINMPLMNGIETLKKIRADKLIKDTKVLMFTAEASKRTVATTAELGISGYVKKPFNTEDLVSRVKDCLY